ncbi:Bacterial Ig-like domain (group 1) [uncultured archaeon]|nr:Bacterial Ig-like domain (group 1) [uncultured archaeon]
MSAKLLLVLSLFILLAQPCFSLWNQSIGVYANDSAGAAVKGANVAIVFQNASALADNDGLITGVTGADGHFYANLTNIVPPAYENRNYSVELSTYYWKGETKVASAGGSGAASFSFTVPFELRQLGVKVSDAEGIAVDGAHVYLENGTDVLQSGATGATGVALFSVPYGIPVAGYASYGGVSQIFNGSENGSAIDIYVQLPARIAPPGGNAAGSGGSVLTLTVMGKEGTRLPGQPVQFSYNGSNTTAYADSNGLVSYSINGSGNVSVASGRYEYVYREIYSVSGNTSKTLLLGHLLAINSFDKTPDGTGCYKLFVNVTDPRNNLPIDVRISRYGPAANLSLPIAPDENGLLVSRICITEDTQVKAVAVNKYDSAEAVLDLPYLKAQPPVKNVTITGAKTVISAQQQGELDENILGAVAVALVIGFFLALVFARRYLAQIFRFISEYLRLMYENIVRKRRGMPPKPQ